nr:Fic family protein [Gleimia europaea]
MAEWRTDYWEPNLSAPGKRERMGGKYSFYVPDFLAEVNLKISRSLDRELIRVERQLRELSDVEGADDLAHVARFLLRSEAIASSQMEGITPAPKQVALAELGEQEDIRGISDAAQLVARNMTAVQRASSVLSNKDRVTPSDLEDLQESLLGDKTQGLGIRQAQNWIGRSFYHPIGADYVPPDPSLVSDLVRDLAEYIDGAKHGAVVQAALVHAQFETIHPFADGNGRVGRALIHTVLARRGLTPKRVLPVSLVLATLSHEYVRALTEYRYVGDVNSSEAHRAREQWIKFFARSVSTAVQQALELNEELSRLRLEWTEKIEEYRSQQGKTKKLRADSATMRILNRLPGTPILTIKTTQDIHGLKPTPARSALEDLRQADVLVRQSINAASKAYVAQDVLDLITYAERQLASTQFDTRVSLPNRPVPARPER